MRKKKETCPICGRELHAGSGFTKHVEACSRRPDDETLREAVADDVPISELRRMYKTSDPILRTWLASIGEEDYRRGAAKPNTYEETEDGWALKDMDLCPEAAPMFNRVKGGCHNCGGAVFFCRNLYRKGMCVLCEAPTAFELQLAEVRWVTMTTSSVSVPS